ncbi:MAG: DUF4440 domain-containing protein [Calditrichales bacterium]|nr:MAG: DUF4440 domain-containing protein [Calditrichales bacterium]
MRVLMVTITLLVLNQILIAQNTIPDSLLTVYNTNMQTWMNAYNGGDADKLIPLYAEDADYISSHVQGLVAKGRNRLIENFRNGMKMGGHIDKIEILSVNYACDLATLLCKYEATNNGQKAIGRNLLVLKKSKNKWLIIIHMTVV